jgi:carbamoyltransferase
LCVKELAKLAGCKIDELPVLLFTEHHQSHAASAFFPSPFERAAVLCMDGVGEWATTSVWTRNGNRLDAEWEIDFPDSLGLLYSAFAYFTGFKVNSGEYKLMGLAPYGEPRFRDKILDHLISVKEDGTFRMDMDYFSYANGLTMTSKQFDALFEGPPRKPESPLTQREMDIARSTLPAITHVDYAARIQTVHQETNPRYHALLNAFHARTGCPVLVNTSFNVRREPIVCSPEEAYRCFMRTEMDYLVLDNYLLAKVEQPAWDKDEFELD